MNSRQKPLPVPLRELLAEPAVTDDARVALAAVRARGRRRQLAVRTARYGLAACAAALLIAFMPRMPWPHVQLPFASAPAPVALRLVPNGDLPAILHAGARYRAFGLSDGSWVTLAANAEIEVLEATPRVLRLALRKGRARFDVRPRGPRTWIVECAAVTVQVVGTGFVVDRGADATRVQVARGAVLVRGNGVPDGVQRLAAGQSLEIPLPREAARAPATAPESASAAIVQQSEERAKPKPNVSWRGAAERGEWSQAWHALRGRGFESTVKSARDVEELLLLADIARLSGHARHALAPLERVAAEHADDARAALAAFTMGTLRLDSLDEPARAASDVARALKLGLPRPLQQDAQARLVEAYARGGDAARAAAAAAEYRSRFPKGSRRAQVDAWSGTR